MSNQERLLLALNDVVDIDKPYLVDGHFCLLDMEHNIVPVDFSIIKAINPRRIFLLTEEVEIIQRRLLERDGKQYDQRIITDMEAKERELAQNFSIQYDIPVTVLRANEYHKVKDVVSEFGKEYAD